MVSVTATPASLIAVGTLVPKSRSMWGWVKILAVGNCETKLGWRSHVIFGSCKHGVQGQTLHFKVLYLILGQSMVKVSPVHLFPSFVAPLSMLRPH